MKSQFCIGSIQFKRLIIIRNLAELIFGLDCIVCFLSGFKVAR